MVASAAEEAKGGHFAGIAENAEADGVDVGHVVGEAVIDGIVDIDIVDEEIENSGIAVGDQDFGDDEELEKSVREQGIAAVACPRAFEEAGVG